MVYVYVRIDVDVESRLVLKKKGATILLEISTLYAPIVKLKTKK